MEIMNNNEFQHQENQPEQIGNVIEPNVDFSRNLHCPVSANNNFNRLPVMKPIRTYNEYDKYFAIAALILGFVMIKVFLSTFLTGGGFLSTVLFLGISLFNYFYCKKSGMDGSRETKAVFYITLVLSSLFVITDNAYVKTINFWLVICSNLYFVYASYPSNNNSIIHNLLKAVFSSPFYEFSSLFEALFSRRSRMSKPKNGRLKGNIFPIVLGLLFSIPVCIVVMCLLASSDGNFGRIFGRLVAVFLDRFIDKFVVNVMLFIFSVPIGMYIFGAVYSRAYKMRNENKLKHMPSISKRVLPSSMCNAFLTPLILIYTAFVLTQISYLFDTFESLNESFSYSEYARSGFFELCFVVMINLSVIAAVMFFVKLRHKKLPLSVKVFIVLFSVLTLCLIVTALVKMMMYIDIYGMTPLRVYTSMFMIYLFVLFIVLIFKQFKFGISFTKISYCLAVIVIAAMSLIPVDGLIAEYNIEKYQQGEIYWMGFDAMMELDSSAVGVFAENDFLMDIDGCRIEKYFSAKSSIGDMDIYDFNLTRYFASRIVKEYTLQ